MINLKYITKERLQISCKRRGFQLNIDELYEIYEKHKESNQQLEILYSKKNQFYELNDTTKELKENIKILEQNVEQLKSQLDKILREIPNLLDSSVPDGLEGTIIKQYGNLTEYAKPHYNMNLIKSTEMCGSRFVVLESELATLERALGQFMINYVISKGFSEHSLPYLIKSSYLYHTGHLPKDADNMFHDDEFYLIPTSEVALIGYKGFQKYSFDELPVRVTSLTDCFRKEAGASGRDTKGLIRLHQFKKCEMVVIANPNNSYEILDEMVEISTSILEQLEIPYRIKLLGAEDIGFTSAKTYDIEIPIGNEWREVASLSNCEIFQSLGLQIKSKETNEYLHTLNGSGLAVGRTLASLMEIHYDSNNNRINVPKCLHNYVNFSYIQLI
jgi:seryl-tRNA synthetase